MNPPKPPPIAWPLPADTAAAQRLAEAFAATSPAAARFAKGKTGAAVLACLGGNAPYLAELALRHPGCLLQTCAAGPDHVLARILDSLARQRLGQPRARLMQALRAAKAQAALVIALADLGGGWTLSQITAALSALAQACLAAAIRHLLRELHDTGVIRLAHKKTPERDCGFTALALGKLGAHELNYSSDIDLVLLYDPQNPAYPAQAQSIMARFARDLITLLSHRDADGYVFRVDLRLRPDPAATPPVIALPAALAYYESHGRTWERAAFSKARPAAGDLALGESFLAAIRPFIWRRHLDFAAIGDIHGMKRQIDAGATHSGLPGLNVKLCQGGIREIEFIVQTLGLVWGGEIPALRIPATLQALPALAKAGHLPAAVAQSLAADYRELRRVEHRLQMVDDRQTHTLPDTPAGLATFAIFLAEPDFSKTFPRLLTRVHKHFLAFFDAGDAAEQRHTLDPGATGDPPAAFAAHLKDLGFTGIRHIAERLRAWLSGTMPALRADRARGLLAGLAPALLAALARQPEADRAFARFDAMLSRQRAGVQLLSLLQRNPRLLDRLAAVLGAAPALAEHLSADPQALEALLVPAARFAAPKPLLRHALSEARDLEDAVSLTRRFIRREDFHLSVATLEARLDADAAGRLRSNLAQAAIAILLPRVVAAHRQHYGKIRGAAFAVVALGKAGGGEMLAGSDLDLLLIYDHALEIPPTQYFIRLAHAVTGALTAQGPEGPLYKVDMRLRPSGNQGPVAVSLAAFAHYHATESWTWERLALTRARVLAATSPAFAARITAAIIAALCRPADPAAIRADVLAMHRRLASELPAAGPFDVKHLPGGLLQLAFIPETLQLIHGPADPSLFCPNTADALRALAAAGHLPPADATALIAADHLWRSIQGIDRITGLRERETTPAPAMLAPLLRATATATLADLTHTMAAAAQTVQNCFTRIIQPPGDTS